MSEPKRYSYPLPGVSGTLVHAEVAALNLPGFLSVGTSGPQLDVVFVEPLDAADIDRLDALLIAYTPPDAATARRLLARRQALARVADGDEGTVRLRAALKTVLSAVAADRQYMAQLRAALQSLGVSLPPPPPVRSWTQLEQAVRQMIEAGEGDGGT